MKMQEHDELLKKQVEEAGGIWEGIQPWIFDIGANVIFRSPITKHILHCPSDLCNKKTVQYIISQDSSGDRKTISHLGLLNVIQSLEKALESLRKILGETK